LVPEAVDALSRLGDPMPVRISENQLRKLARLSNTEQFQWLDQLQVIHSTSE